MRASCQQLDSELDKEKQPPFVTLGGDYPIRWSYVNLSQSTTGIRRDEVSVSYFSLSPLASVQQVIVDPQELIEGIVVDHHDETP